MAILDPQGEEIAPGDERACAVCKELDHKDAGRACEACGEWSHEDCCLKCEEAPLWSDCHILCRACYEAGCPICADIQEEAATNRHNDLGRWTK